MAPHCHRLSAYASERLVSLFDMLAKKYIHLLFLLSLSYLCFSLDNDYCVLLFRTNNKFFTHSLTFPTHDGSRYNKLAEQRDDKTHIDRGNSVGEDSLVEDMVLLQCF